MELHLTKVHSPDLISEMKGLFFDLAQEKNLSLEFEDTYNDIFVTDKEKFAQVLKNILSNAIKFTHVGTISIEVKAENGLLNIIVSDTGIGIAQDKLDSIFDAFKQVDGSISREFGGTGLGLSITKTILDLMNAQIEVTSEPKKGTTFSIFLPLLKEHPDVVDSIEMKVNNFLPFNDISDEDEELQENSLESKNILIVDDDSRNIFTLTSLLESSGAEVFSAFNGTEAIAIVKKEKIDLILMDMMMPVMDGLEATKIIKSMNAHLPIIAITANTGEEDKQKCLDAGADEYLSKPIDTNSLFSMLHAWIK